MAKRGPHGVYIIDLRHGGLAARGQSRAGCSISGRDAAIKGNAGIRAMRSLACWSMAMGQIVCWSGPRANSSAGQGQGQIRLLVRANGEFVCWSGPVANSSAGQGQMATRLLVRVKAAEQGRFNIRTVVNGAASVDDDVTRVTFNR